MRNRLFSVQSTLDYLKNTFEKRREIHTKNINNNIVSYFVELYRVLCPMYSALEENNQQKRGTVREQSSWRVLFASKSNSSSGNAISRFFDQIDLDMFYLRVLNRRTFPSTFGLCTIVRRVWISYRTRAEHSRLRTFAERSTKNTSNQY